jgi:hypothetical protein
MPYIMVHFWYDVNTSPWQVFKKSSNEYDC